MCQMRSVTLLAVLCLTLLPSPPAATQERFSGESRVTAVDLLVTLQDEEGRVRKGPDDLAAEDFRVLVEGQELPVVGMESPREVDDTEGVHTLIYIDRALVGDAGVAWAALLLEGAAGEMVRMGTVEIVVADPEPRGFVQVRKGQKDGERMLRGALSNLLREAAAPQLPPIPGTETEGQAPRDGRSGLEKRRAAAIEALAAETLVSRQGERAAALAGEEAAFLQQRLDALILLLLDRQAEGELAARRQLLWVTDGLDDDPARFYGTLTPAPVPAPVESVQAVPGLEAAAEATGRLAAAYGWRVHGILPPPAPSPIQPGVRIGKLRLYLPGAQGRQAFFPSAMVGGTWEANREPKKAESYLDLGRSYQEAGKLEAAEEAFRLAIYHFDGDPRTAERQAEAWRSLGDVLESAGDPVAGRLARAVAVQLDPSLAEELPAWNGGPLDPRPPLVALTGETAGDLVQSPSGLSTAFEGLRRSFRLTFQRTGFPDGRVVPVTVRLAPAEARAEKLSGLAATVPGWTRSAAPEEVAELRLRRFLTSPFDEERGLPRGGLPVVAGAALDREGALRLVLRLGPGASPDVVVAPRLSWVTGEDDGTLHFHHRLLEPFPAAEAARWRHDEPLETEGEIAVVLLEDLLTGRWGMALAEIP